jgi:hypothetical protein
MAYYSCDFNIGFNAISDNTGGHISHLAGAFFGFLYSITAKGIDLSEIVTGVIFFTNLVNKSSVTPFKKVHKNYGKPADKKDF